MATKKAARRPKAKKLVKAKKMNAVKPLAVDAFIKIDGVPSE